MASSSATDEKIYLVGLTPDELESRVTCGLCCVEIWENFLTKHLESKGHKRGTPYLGTCNVESYMERASKDKFGNRPHVRVSEKEITQLLYKTIFV